MKVQYAPPPPGQSPKEVYFYVQVFSISKISGADQTFQAYFYLVCAWLEPKIAKDKRHLDAMKKKMEEYDGSGK